MARIPRQSVRPLLPVMLALALAAGCGSEDGGEGNDLDDLGGRGGNAPGPGGSSAVTGGTEGMTGGEPGSGGVVGVGGSPSAGGSGVGGAPGAGGSGVGGAQSGGAPGVGGAQSGGAPGAGGSGVGGAQSGGAPGVGGSGPGGAAGSAGDLGAGGSGVGGDPGAGGSGVGGDPGSGGSGTGGDPGVGGSGTGGDPGSGGTGTGGLTGCPMDLEGWATVSGDGVSTTTGGDNATPVRPTSAQELIDYASDGTPRVIEIEGTFNVPRLQVASNKTLIGIGANATINGGIRIRGYADANVSNVIVRNLNVNGASTDVDGDAMQVYFAHHVWVDHCEIWDGVDANLDVTHASNWVTISWTIFRYTSAAPDPSHKFSNLFGHSDNNADEDRGRLNITAHHNWWREGVTERMPRVRFGQVHVFNNYYTSTGNNYCVRAGTEAHILSESNYFQGVNSPHVYNNATDETTSYINRRNNVFDATTGTNVSGGGGTPFDNPPYSASIDDANDVPALVQACAGPR